MALRDVLTQHFDAGITGLNPCSAVGRHLRGRALGWYELSDAANQILRWNDTAVSQVSMPQSITNAARVKGAAEMQGRFRRAALIAASLLYTAVQPAQSAPQLYTTYIGEHPANADPGYHEDVQGVAHDQDYWYITQSDPDDSNPSERSIWKIPLTHDLESVSISTPNIQVVVLDTIPGLAGYNHFGDPEHYVYNDIGYLLVPVEGPGLVPVVAVFKTESLAFVGKAPLYHNNSGWIAIDPTGLFYSSDDPLFWVFKYSLKWDLLEDNVVQISLIGEIQLTDEDGKALKLEVPQGGVFSEGGKYLYLISGTWDKHVQNEGISVFDADGWQRVARSANGSGQFNYEFHPGSWPDEAEEPEGITVWDLESGIAPSIRGRLHVFMLDNDGDGDEIWFKHYR